MNDLRKAAKMALEALEGVVKNCWRDIPSWRLDEIKEQSAALRTALAQPDWTTDTPVPPFKYFDFAEYKGTGNAVKIKHSINAQPDPEHFCDTHCVHTDHHHDCELAQHEKDVKACDADALPPTANAVYWMDMVVANLVRNGVNKHRARELAYHFYTYTTPLENSNG